MADDRAARLARVNAILQSSPQWQDFARRAMSATGGSLGTGFDSVEMWQRETPQLFASLGLSEDDLHDLRFDPATGVYKEAGFMDRNPWVGGALAAGGAVSAGLIPGAWGPTGAAPTVASETGSAFAGALPSLIGPALTAAVPLIGRALGGSGGGPGEPGGGPGVPPELTQLLQDAMRRMQAQEPLFQQVNQQALAGLPSSTLRPPPLGMEDPWPRF